MSEVYVLGGAQSDFERNWTKEGKDEIALLREVIFDCLENVNLSKEDIKNLNKDNRIAGFVGNFIAEKYLDQGHLGPLLTIVDACFDGIPCARYEAACASGSVALDAAISKIRCGDYDVCLVVGFEIMKAVCSSESANILGRAAYYKKECQAMKYPFPELFGKLAEETIKKYNLNEQRYLDNLAMISNINYQNAKRNPNAQTRKWYMSLKHAQNRGVEYNPLVGGLLAVSDCSQTTDGAAAVVLVSEKFLKEKGLKDKPIVKGFGHRVAPMIFEDKIKRNNDSEYILPWTRQAVIDAYNRSGLSVDDIDVFETHDCFSSSEYAAISSFGLTKPGQEYMAIESGQIAFNGNKPINPSGGLIGCGHPVGASGVRMFLDIYKQVAGEAGEYQIKNVNNAMMLNIGGSATTNYVFVVGKK